MKKKREQETVDMSSERKEILDLCYKRLRQLIPECTNEVTLIKCVEILEKHEVSSHTQPEGQRTLLAIASTLERLSELD